MADDQYEGREEKYLSTIGTKVAGVVTPLVEAHVSMQKAYAQMYAEMANKEIVPLRVVVATGTTRKMLQLDIPLILVAPIRPLDYDAGTGVSTRMAVSANQEEATKVGSKVEAGVQVGWGPVAASFKAEVTVDHDTKRSSDYSSTIDIDVKLISREPPEMVQKIGDILVMFIQEAIKDLVANDGLQELPDADPDPEITDGGEGGDGAPAEQAA